jgi:mannose-1-phosphate guanylyltransferase/mannose-6-phosphate isomerase
MIDGKSLLQETLLRIRGIADVGPPVIVCNQDYRFIIAEQMNDIGFENARIILEPEGKNTAPAITIAALYLEEYESDALMLVLPADHVINNHESFITSVGQSAKLAEQGTLVTFGVVPTRPETGYGYIQKSTSITTDAFTVKKFVEKPDLKTAKKYLDSGEYFWNSGMFMFNVSAYLDEIEQHAPDILASCRECMKEMNIDLDFLRIKPAQFRACRSESIDYALMEKSGNIAVVTLDADWSDVGSWNAMFDIHEIDKAGNVLKGDVFTDQVSNSYLHAESRLLAAVGISDLAVVETADAVLVAHKDSCQDVKGLVNLLKKNNRSEIEHHRRVYRPWGYYESLNSAKNFQVKHLVVKPGAKLSLQMHQYRSEHWVVIKGVAVVTCGESVFELTENQSTFIPAGNKHRLENKSDELLELIEVQTGSYFGEDDIVRFEDIYKRDVT